MKFYISGDIEGVTGVTSWNETELGHHEHTWAREQMLREINAACEALIELGASEIVVKDAHDSGRNIDISKLPLEVNSIRGWTGGPESMMVGIDETFDGVIFIGYHSGSFENGNPLAHTFNSEKAFELKVNGKTASEFCLNARIAAYYGVPILFLSGDQDICNTALDLVPNMEVFSTKSGLGNGTFNVHPLKSLDGIKDGVKKAFEKRESLRLEKEEDLLLEITYKEHKDAFRASYYEGVELVDNHTVKYKSKDIMDLMTARMFIL